MAKYRPLVILSAAVSIDGKIATKRGDSNISSKKDLTRLHKLRSKVDAILIGTNTLHMDDPILNVRYVKGKDPVRVILDTKGTISTKSKILKTCKKIPTIIVVSKMISQRDLLRLQSFSLDVVVLGTYKIDISKLMKVLLEKNIKTLLVEGGGTINWEFIEKNLFDRLIVTVSPKIIGGSESISFIQGEGFSKISRSPKLKLDKIQRIENEVVLYYSKTMR